MIKGDTRSLDYSSDEEDWHHLGAQTAVTPTGMGSC